MALKYSAHQLLKLKRNYVVNDFHAICGDVGILQRKRYIHRSSQRSFTHSPSDVVSYPTFFCIPQRLSYRSAGINYDNLSVPLYEEESTRMFFESPHLLKSAVFNARSVNNKDIYFLTSLWKKK